MSHKNAPALTPDQVRFEAAVTAGLEVGHSVGMGRDKDGLYFARYVREMWAIWQAAQQPHTRGEP